MHKRNKLTSIICAAALLSGMCTVGAIPAAAATTANVTTFTFSDSGITVSNETDTNYKIEGTSLTINGKGSYKVTGSCSDGSVKVKKSTTGVTLTLSDLTLTSTTTAPLMCNKNSQADIIIDGTVNLEDNVQNSEDYWIDQGYSESDSEVDSAENAVIKFKGASKVTMSGDGTLNIKANAKNGIKSGATLDSELENELAYDPTSDYFAYLTMSGLNVNIDTTNVYTPASSNSSSSGGNQGGNQGGFGGNQGSSSTNISSADQSKVTLSIDGTSYSVGSSISGASANSNVSVLLNGSTEIIGTTSKVNASYITFAGDINGSSSATLTYNSNNSSNSTSTVNASIGETVTIGGNTFSYDGYTFVGWNTKADGTGTSYSAGDSFVISSDSTLYAIWKDNSEETAKFTASFGYDSGVKNITVYDTQDYTASGTVTDTAVVKDGDTGEIDASGSGQVNFKVNLADGYEVDEIKITEGAYKNLKDVSTDSSPNTYRITKITDDIEVYITTVKSSSDDSDTDSDTELVNKSYLSETTVTAGTAVTATGSASGGTAPYTYAFYWKKSSSSTWITKSAYGKADTVSYSFSTAGTYDIKILVKDGSGTVETFTSQLTVTASTLVNNSTLSATTVKPGTAITATAAAEGGTGSYTYAYYWKKASGTGWNTKKTYSSTESMTYTFNTAGAYNVRIVAKDSSGKTKSVTYNVYVTTMTNTSTLSKTTVTKGTAITATGNSSGSSGDKEYAFYWKKSTSTVWTTKSAYGNAESVAYTFNTPGTYNIKISVKDSTGAIVAKEFTVTVNS